MLGFDLGKAVSLCHFHRHFQEEAVIGSGGFSTVYKVKNKTDHLSYALKVIKIKPSSHKYDISDHIDKVLGEVKLLSALSHRNILKYHGCWIDGEEKTEKEALEEIEEKKEEEIELVFYEDSEESCGFEFGQNGESQKEKESQKVKQRKIQYEDISILGENLTKYKEIRIYILAELGKHSLQKFVELRNKANKKHESRIDFVTNYQIILDIIDGLSYIHSQKIIHRDLKLQNVIIDNEGKCKIIDFGLAKKVRSLKSMDSHNLTSEIDVTNEQEKHSSSIGTKIYSSPEQSSSSSYDQRTDIYSLAMIIAILFSDYITIHEERQQLSNIRNKKLDQLPLPLQLKQTILKCLSEQKFRPSLKEIKEVVRNLLKECVLKESKAVKYGRSTYINKDGKIKRKANESEKDIDSK